VARQRSANSCRGRRNPGASRTYEKEGKKPATAGKSVRLPEEKKSTQGSIHPHLIHWDEKKKKKQRRMRNDIDGKRKKGAGLTSLLLDRGRG